MVYMSDRLITQANPHPLLTPSNQSVCEAGTAKIYHWRVARETYFERCFPWNLMPKSGLIAVDPSSVDRKLRDAKSHLPRVFLTRRRRAESSEGRLSTTVVTVNDAQSRDFARSSVSILQIARHGRIARLSGVHQDQISPSDSETMRFIARLLSTE